MQQQLQTLYPYTYTIGVFLEAVSLGGHFCLLFCVVPLVKVMAQVGTQRTDRSAGEDSTGCG